MDVVAQTYFCLMLLIAILSILGKNWRLHVLVTVFSFGWIATMLIGNPIHWSIELLISAITLYTIFYIHFKKPSDVAKPYWLAPIMLAEVAILFSHLTLLMNPYRTFYWLVQILFAFELLYCIGYGFYLTYRRFRPREA